MESPEETVRRMMKRIKFVNDEFGCTQEKVEDILLQHFYEETSEIDFYYRRQLWGLWWIIEDSIIEDSTNTMITKNYIRDKLSMILSRKGINFQSRPLKVYVNRKIEEERRKIISGARARLLDIKKGK